MFGLTPLVMAAIAAAVIAVMGGGAWWARDAGKAAQREADAPVIEQWKGKALAAEQINSGLRQQLSTLDGQVQACNTQVERLGKIGDTVRQDISASKAASDARLRGIETRLVEFQRRASTVSSAATPQLQCEAAREVLGELSDRMREILGVAPPPSAPNPANRMRVTK